ncbi:MAG: peptide-methionine (S)-S-oxide reductase MsrA [Bacilli bacterium]|nr:peptide-methionine (S)-S-oxide reductase MsrA [Bacilli bacterium]
MKTAYFAGGCFWCISYTFENIKGVKDVISGFSGGDEINPTYEDVKAQKTLHRETIKIEYDENICSFEKLLKIFITNVDPFDADGQFIDRGRSYSLAIYYNDEEEYQISKQYIDKLKEERGMEVFISLEKFKNFYEAEEYHQFLHTYSFLLINY